MASSPTNNSNITRPYGPTTLEYKIQNKVALQEELGWPTEPKRPMLCLSMGMTDQLGGELLKELVPGLMGMDLQLIILGKGSSAYGTYFTELTKKYGHRVAILPNTEKGLEKMVAAADMSLFLKDASNTPELALSLAYGTVPVAPATTALENYDPNQEAGDSFTFEKENVWHAFAAVVRAMETYRFPYDWRTIQRHAMEKAA